MQDSVDVLPMSAPAASSGPKTEAARATILVCEDEPLIRMNLVDLLEELGYEVLEAGDARGALEHMTNARIDVAITDLGLPDMSGERLAASLRSRSPGLPILFATGRGREDEPLLTGPSGYLAKPFTMKTLAAALADLAQSGVAPVP